MRLKLHQTLLLLPAPGLHPVGVFGTTRVKGLVELEES